MAPPLLIVGNKKYSSWSLRAWLAFKHLGIPFRERRVALFTAEGTQEIAKHSLAGKVPILVDDDVTVHESLAILEYANEVYAQGALLPAGRVERALARAVCAEMHSGFPSLRQAMPMNMARRRGIVPATDAVRGEIQRVLALWESLRDKQRGGPFLFGTFGMADCMFMPVVTRFDTYLVDLASHPRSLGYLHTMLTLPAFLEWRQAGQAEPEVIAEDEV